MVLKVTFLLDEEAVNFLNKVGGNNKSAYINDLLKKEQQKALEDAILKANLEEASCEEYQKELKLWDVTLSDDVNVKL